MWFRKQFMNNVVFPSWACAAGFNYNNNYGVIHKCFTSQLYNVNRYEITFANSC